MIYTQLFFYLIVIKPNSMTGCWPSWDELIAETVKNIIKIKYSTGSNVLFSFSLVVRRLQSKGILIQIFPLHEQEELKRLSFSWYKRLKLSLQPLGESQICPAVCLVRTLLDELI